MDHRLNPDHEENDGRMGPRIGRLGRSPVSRPYQMMSGIATMRSSCLLPASHPPTTRAHRPRSLRPRLSSATAWVGPAVTPQSSRFLRASSEQRDFWADLVHDLLKERLIPAVRHSAHFETGRQANEKAERTTPPLRPSSLTARCVCGLLARGCRSQTLLGCFLSPVTRLKGIGH